MIIVRRLMDRFFVAGFVRALVCVVEFLVRFLGKPREPQLTANTLKYGHQGIAAVNFIV